MLQLLAGGSISDQRKVSKFLVGELRRTKETVLTMAMVFGSECFTLFFTIFLCFVSFEIVVFRKMFLLHLGLSGFITLILQIYLTFI